jgi:hypothetical protein
VVDQSGTTANRLTTQEATVNHAVSFGNDGKNSLISTLRYTDDSGRVQFEHFRWDERLRLKHSDSLETHYEYSLDWYKVLGSERLLHNANAGFVHKLYKSLVTSGVVTVQKSDEAGSDEVSVSGSLDTSYVKHVPYGTLNIDAAVGYQWQRSSASGASQVVQQPVTFVDPLPIVLPGTSVNPRSIVITDPSGLVLFQPGRDYNIVPFPDRLEIERVVGGRIGPGQSVLLDYVLAPHAAFESSTTTFGTGTRYSIEQGPLRGLSLYARYATANQSISTDQPNQFQPNSFNETSAGFDYFLREITVGYEHQIHDATVGSYDLDRVYATWTHRIADQTNFGINGAYTAIDFSDPQSHTDLYTVSLQIQHRFTNELYGTASVLYRNQHDDLVGRTEGFEQQVDLEWRHRQTRIYIMLRNSSLDTVNQSENFQFFQVGMHRDF